MAGSAYTKDRIELVILRQSKNFDSLGINEPLIDWSPDNKGINVTSNFKLAWTSRREDLYSQF